MISSQLNHLPEALPSNTLTLQLDLQYMNFRETHSVHITQLIPIECTYFCAMHCSKLFILITCIDSFICHNTPMYRYYYCLHSAGGDAKAQRGQYRSPSIVEVWMNTSLRGPEGTVSTLTSWHPHMQEHLATCLSHGHKHTDNCSVVGIITLNQTQTLWSPEASGSFV